MLVTTHKTKKSKLLSIGIVDLCVRLIRARYVLIIKRVVDMAVSSIGIVAASPLMLTLCSIIKLTSRGPVFYTQTRVGKDGKLFNIIKFRTMRTDAEDASGPVWAKSADPRVTKVGYYLRALHLDEIPQIFNILKGEMSFVGPRPERPFFVDSFKMQIQGYPHRLTVKPGLTGLAQVRYKYDETIEDVKNKLSYDLFYISKVCLILDCKIFLWTMGKVASTFKEFFHAKKGDLGSGKEVVPVVQ